MKRTRTEMSTPTSNNQCASANNPRENHVEGSVVMVWIGWRFTVNMTLPLQTTFITSSLGPDAILYPQLPAGASIAAALACPAAAALASS
jgi:hypothetical protein